MKLKNVNFAERHVEKFVFALGVILFLVVVWTYSMGSPYAVSIAGDSRVRPGGVEVKVLEAESRLNAKIEPGSPSPLPPMTVPAYTAMFRKRIDQPLLSTAGLDPLAQPGLELADSAAAMGENGQWRVPVAPAPVRVQARSGYGVLLEPDRLASRLSEIQADGFGAPLTGQDAATAYEQLVGSNQPRDFRYVSVGGLFNVAAWRKMRPHSGGIPQDWWDSSLALADVVLERQAFDPAQGRWGSEVVIAALPDAVSFRDPPKIWTKKRAQACIASIKQWQDQIARAPFAPMPKEAAWQAPVVDGMTGLTDQEYVAYLGLTQEIDQLRNQIRQARSANPAASESSSSSATQMPESATDALRRQLDDAVARRDQMLAAAKRATGLAAGWWSLWRHDLTVKPGETYRYRLRVALVNPLFQRPQLDDPLRERYFHVLSVASAASAWTAPVTVEPAYRFFVVGGSGVQREATIEVWRVVNGKQHVHEFRVRPGDPLGGVVAVNVGGKLIDVDMSIGALVVDLVDRQLGRDIDSRSTLLYVDLATNQLLVRTIDADRKSPERAGLMDQALVKSGVAEFAGGSADRN